MVLVKAVEIEMLVAIAVVVFVVLMLLVEGVVQSYEFETYFRELRLDLRFERFEVSQKNFHLVEDLHDSVNMNFGKVHMRVHTMGFEKELVDSVKTVDRLDHHDETIVVV